MARQAHEAFAEAMMNLEEIAMWCLSVLVCSGVVWGVLALEARSVAEG